MPELPEVETTLRGIRPHVVKKRVVRVVVRNRRLRWPVPASLAAELVGQTITAARRRAKYLLLETRAGTVLIHLGMSGGLRVVSARTPPGRHDHVDLVLSSGDCLRYHDPRRFGAILWTRGDPGQDPLLSRLGPEPLTRAFTGRVLQESARGRTAAVKSFIMDARVVAGVGNIYASEALFLAGIRPERAAGALSPESCARLACAIKRVLRDAIHRGGTTLRDFKSSDGRPGRFQARLNVYGRAGEPCRRCGAAVLRTRPGQRSAYHCPRCQR
ncbi:MAG: bifunctional DNA-formamidopyrimidine glycosylase/DNA-(apurinic or apyrimidinic site) lyase [Planctomycetes bacterium]|nr:bifunctional DNA-formamidopyrimidine glycosylase/DNA-(apurinic or apyrimidinic site) lyase [Planctomycetota bacterium]